LSCKLLAVTSYLEMDLLYGRVMQIVTDALTGKSAEEEIRALVWVKDDMLPERKREVTHVMG
jgi:hypothetical protein